MYWNQIILINRAHYRNFRYPFWCFLIIENAFFLACFYSHLLPSKWDEMSKWMKMRSRKGEDAKFNFHFPHHFCFVTAAVVSLSLSLVCECLYSWVKWWRCKGSSFFILSNKICSFFPLLVSLAWMYCEL